MINSYEIDPYPCYQPTNERINQDVAKAIGDASYLRIPTADIDEDIKLRHGINQIINKFDLQNKPETIDFLRKHIDFIDPLLRIFDVISKIFIPSKSLLRYYLDIEEGSEILFIEVKSSLNRKKKALKEKEYYNKIEEFCYEDDAYISIITKIL